MISSAGLIKFNSSNTDTIYGLYTKYATEHETCVLITLSNVGIYRRFFESNLAKNILFLMKDFCPLKICVKNIKMLNLLK